MLDVEETVSLRLRLMSLPSVKSGATPGRLTVGAFDDKFLACDRCGIGGGALGDLAFRSSTFSIPLMLGLIGKRPVATVRLAGRGVSTLLSLSSSC